MNKHLLKAIARNMADMEADPLESVELFRTVMECHGKTIEFASFVFDVCNTAAEMAKVPEEEKQDAMEASFVFITRRLLTSDEADALSEEIEGGI
jgi:hypothetical protein